MMDVTRPDGFQTNRRQFLKHTGVVSILALSGCTALSDDAPPPGRRVTDLSVTGLESDPVSVMATATRSQITPLQTANIELTVIAQPEDSVSLTFGNSIPFSYPKKSQPPGLLLLPDQDYARESQQTWIPADSIIAVDQQLVIETSNGGHVSTREWSVWGDPEHVSSIEPGTYEFTSEIGVDPPGDDFDWTLSMTIATESPDT